jgi:twitching motility two-component system response regulator PilH
VSIFDRFNRWLGRADKPVATSAPVARTLPPTPEPESVSEPVTAVEPDVQAEPIGAPFGKERRQQDRQPAAEGVRILVVDDSPTIVLMLSRMLEQNGYEVIEAGDAETGMELARTSMPHLVFLDIVLPGMNGFEALRRLRRDPVTRSIPVIMISGNELATEQFYAQRIGADDFMKKPFSRSEVFLRIEKLLGPDRIPKPHVTPARG